MFSYINIQVYREARCIEQDQVVQYVQVDLALHPPNNKSLVGNDMTEIKIKALKTLVWYLSKEPVKGMSSLKKKIKQKSMTNKSRRTRQRTNNLKDQLMWG